MMSDRPGKIEKKTGTQPRTTTLEMGGQKCNIHLQHVQNAGVGNPASTLHFGVPRALWSDKGVEMAHTKPEF